MNFSDDGDLRPRAYDLIVFDWDGTLFDSTALIARSIQLACEDMGLPVPARHEAAYVIGLGLHDALAHVAPTLPADQVPAMGQRYRHHYFRQQGELSLFDGTVELLQALKARHHRSEEHTSELQSQSNLV